MFYPRLIRELLYQGIFEVMVAIRYSLVHTSKRSYASAKCTNRLLGIWVAVRY